MQYRVIYITTKNEEEATRIGKKLVEEKLIACVNIIPKVRSIYREGKEITDETEAVMICKTKADLEDEVIKRVRELHSYEVPEIISLKIEKGWPEYLNWIDQSTQKEIIV
jgi:periplasmic divalent cation tolerance protein